MSHVRHNSEDARQRAYEEEWGKWFGSLPEADQELMRRQGIDKPLRDRDRRPAGNLEPERKAEREGYTADPIDQIEPIDDAQHFTMDEVREALFFILTELKKSRRSRMALDCICFSVGLGVYYKESAQTIADRYGVSRQRVHTMKEGYRDRMGVVGNAFAKKTEARATYALTNYRSSKCPN